MQIPFRKRSKNNFETPHLDRVIEEYGKNVIETADSLDKAGDPIQVESHSHYILGVANVLEAVNQAIKLDKQTIDK